MSNLRDAQDAPGNGPGEGQSPAAGPPQGQQTSFHKYAAMAGNPVTEGFETTNGVLDHAG